MPAWSPDIANEFIALAARDGRAFDHMQLQKLVYIAHGWCLAASGQPLTGDRPEAWAFGPVYRRIADALGAYGRDKVTRHIPAIGSQLSSENTHPEIDEFEMDMIALVYSEYGRLDDAQLSALTQRPGTPWAEIFADGVGENRDVPHRLIREQFVRVTEASENTKEIP